MPALYLCKNCKYFSNHDTPFIASYGHCKLTKSLKPDMIDPINGKLIVSTPKYDFARIERRPTGQCGPHGKLYVEETNPVQRFWNQQSGTFSFLALVMTCFILFITVNIIVSELLVFYGI